ncbi:hypothetical protein NMG60_11002595 [Bertholletia excelsa]
MEPQMLLRLASNRTSTFFHKTLQSFRSFLFGGYQKLAKNRPVNPLHPCKNKDNMQHLEQLYRSLSRRWESNNDKLMKSKKMEEKYLGSFRESLTRDKEQRPSEDKHEEEIRREEKKAEIYHQARKGKTYNRGSFVLAQKMKELEMMDMSDMDLVSDIEEVLHYYSRLTCPVYLDIVDKFFMDMYVDFFLPKASVRITTSSCRLGLLKL